MCCVPCPGGEALDGSDAGAGDLRPQAGLGPPRPLPPQPAHALLQPPGPHAPRVRGLQVSATCLHTQ